MPVFQSLYDSISTKPGLCSTLPVYGTVGTYVQAHEKPMFSNTNAPRSLLDCIDLRYNDIVQGGHELLHQPANSLITRCTLTPLPLTPEIINQVHALAVQEICQLVSRYLIDGTTIL